MIAAPSADMTGAEQNTETDGSGALHDEGDDLHSKTNRSAGTVCSLSSPLPFSIGSVNSPASAGRACMCFLLCPLRLLLKSVPEGKRGLHYRGLITKLGLRQRLFNSLVCNCQSGRAHTQTAHVSMWESRHNTGLETKRKRASAAKLTVPYTQACPPSGRNHLV